MGIKWKNSYNWLAKLHNYIHYGVKEINTKLTFVLFFIYLSPLIFH